MPGPTHEHSRTAIATISIGVSAAFLLAGYEFIRSASNTLFKAAYTSDGLPFVMAAVPVGVIVALLVYGVMLTKMGPRRTLWWTSIGCAALMAGAAGVIAGDSAIVGGKLTMGAWAKPAAAALYVLREAYVVLLIEQYWSFLNSTLGEKAARTLNGPICGVGSVGSAIGGYALAMLVKPLGVVAMPWFAIGAILPAAVASELAYRRCGEPADRGQKPASPLAREPLGLREFLRWRVLPLMLVVIVLTQVMSTTLDLSFQKSLDAAFANDHDGQTAYSGTFYANLANIAGVLQFVVAPLLMRFVPLVVVHAAIPCVHLIACGVFVSSPTLTTAGVALMVFKSLDYSVFRAAKEVLYIPLPFDSRYRAKEVIDVLGYRAAKGGTGLITGIALKTWTITTGAAALASGAVALGAAAAWLLVSVPMALANRHAPNQSANESP